MNDDAALTPLRLAILGLIAMSPQSGYDLKKVFETTPMGTFSSSPGAIYPALKALQRLGWIRGQRQNPRSLRPSLVYTLTEAGDAALRRELERPVTRDELIWSFDLVMLRFAFIERIGNAAALRLLGELRREADAYVKHLERLRATLDEQMTPCTRLALEHGISSHRSTARWAAHAIDELQKLANDKGVST